MDEPQGKTADTDGNSEIEPPIPENVFLIVNVSKAVPLKERLIRIGRSHDNTLVLDDPRVSRHHAEIRLIHDHFVLFDLNSSGGTYVNGQRTNQEMLYRGDLISLAGINLVFMQDATLPGRGATDASGTFRGPGERPTVVYQTSISNKRKKGNS